MPNAKLQKRQLSQANSYYFFFASFAALRD